MRFIDDATMRPYIYRCGHLFIDATITDATMMKEPVTCGKSTPIHFLITIIMDIRIRVFADIIFPLGGLPLKLQLAAIGDRPLTLLLRAIYLYRSQAFLSFAPQACNGDRLGPGRRDLY